MLRILGFIFVLFLFGASLQAKRNPYRSLTIEDYVKVVFTQGDAAKTAYNNFENDTFSNKVAYRQTRLPQLRVDSDLGKSKRSVDGDITRNKTSDGSATLSQPFYPTGADISARMRGTTSRSENGDVVTRSDVKPSYDVTLRQPINVFVGNDTKRSWKRSSISYAINEDSYRRTLQTIQNRARSLYYAVLLRREQKDVEKGKLASSRKAFKITKAMVKAGRYAGVELSRSETRLLRDKRRVENANTALQQARNDAMEYAALGLDEKILFTSKLAYNKLRLSLERLIDYALLHRPDYLAAKRQIALAEINVKEAREQDNMSLEAVGTVTRSDAESGAQTSTSKSWVGGVNLSWPLFDSRITHLRTRSAVNSLENDRISLRSLEKNIRTEVTNAYLDLKRTEAQLEDLKKSQKQGRKTVAIVRTRYKNGRDRLIDVFDSENELRDIELENLNVLISANLSQDDLALLIGGPLKEVEP